MDSCFWCDTSQRVSFCHTHTFLLWDCVEVFQHAFSLLHALSTRTLSHTHHVKLYSVESIFPHFFSRSIERRRRIIDKRIKSWIYDRKKRGFSETYVCLYAIMLGCVNLNQLCPPLPLVSISPTFSARFFRTKVLRASFLHLNLRYELFLAQEYWRKCSHRMLVKKTPVVNFTNILRAAFAPIF